MRFSTVLQLAAASRLPALAAAPAPAARASEADAVVVPQRELPEPLDERVRLIGEWQLGEG